MDIVSGLEEQQDIYRIRVRGVAGRILYQGQRSCRTNIVSGLEEQQDGYCIRVEELQDRNCIRVRRVSEDGDWIRVTGVAGIRVFCYPIQELYILSLRWEFNSSNTIRPLHPDSSGIAVYTPFTGFYLYIKALRSYINILYIKILKITQHKA